MAVVLVSVEREARRVSWRPGAEGAPRERESFAWRVVLEVLVGWAAGGAMRRDWRGRY